MTRSLQDSHAHLLLGDVELRLVQDHVHALAAILFGQHVVGRRNGNRLDTALLQQRYLAWRVVGGDVLKLDGQPSCWARIPQAK
jgi:hypothetical protein